MALGTTSVKVTCPDCGEVIAIPVSIEAGPVENGHLMIKVGEVDTTPAWSHYEAAHMQTQEA